MGFTTEQISVEKKIAQCHSNPIKSKPLEIKKSEFYSFLQNLNCKLELGLE